MLLIGDFFFFAKITILFYTFHLICVYACISFGLEKGAYGG